MYGERLEVLSEERYQCVDGILQAHRIDPRDFIFVHLAGLAALGFFNENSYLRC